MAEHISTPDIALAYDAAADQFDRVWNAGNTRYSAGMRAQLLRFEGWKTFAFTDSESPERAAASAHDAVEEGKTGLTKVAAREALARRCRFDRQRPGAAAETQIAREASGRFA